jgi:hypothetical protein
MSAEQGEPVLFWHLQILPVTFAASMIFVTGAQVNNATGSAVTGSSGFLVNMFFYQSCHIPMALTEGNYNNVWNGSAPWGKRLKIDCRSLRDDVESVF